MTRLCDALRNAGIPVGTSASKDSGDPASHVEHLRAELIRTQSFLGALLNLHWPDSLYEQLDAGPRYENIMIAVKTLLLAESCLHLVVFELAIHH